MYNKIKPDWTCLCWQLKCFISYFTPSQYPLGIQSNTFCEIADYPMIWLIKRLTVFHQKLREAGVEVPEVGGKAKGGVEEDKKNLTEEVRKLKDELDATKKGTIWLWITHTLNRSLFTYLKKKTKLLCACLWLHSLLVNIKLGPKIRLLNKLCVWR